MGLHEGVDRAGGLALWEAQALVGLGFEWCGVYIGGPRSAGFGWSPELLEQLATTGIKFLPIYVGRNLPWDDISHLTADYGQRDGEEAVKIMQNWGYHGGPGQVIAHDTEYDTVAGALNQWLDYIVRWGNVVSAAGYRPVLYAPGWSLDAYAKVAQTLTGAWITRWLGSTRQQPDPKQYVTTSFSGYAMQYTGGTWLQGQKTDFDLNTATDDFLLMGAPSQMGSVVPEVSAMPNSIFFPETGHAIGGGFLRYWQKYGGLMIFGFPITDEIQENGKTVQYFERARFELAAQGTNPANWDVQLGRVGAEVAKTKGYSGSGI